MGRKVKPASTISSRSRREGRISGAIACSPATPNLAKDDTDPRETNQWPHIGGGLPSRRHPAHQSPAAQEILPELVKQVYVKGIMQPENRVENHVVIICYPSRRRRRH
jgi:hypothetical protein